MEEVDCKAVRLWVRQIEAGWRGVVDAELGGGSSSAAARARALRGGSSTRAGRRRGKGWIRATWPREGIGTRLHVCAESEDRRRPTRGVAGGRSRDGLAYEHSNAHERNSAAFEKF